MVIVLMILIIIVVFIVLGASAVFSGGSITKSTVERVALPAGAVDETGYYTDQLDWISNETKLLTGLKYFHKKTGVQPYLYITDNVNGSHHPTESELDAFANKLYDELFTDEAHILLVFFEYNNAYMDRYVCGTQAKTVIDAEAADILLDYVDRYYYDDSLTDEEFFSKAFSEAADRIMTVTRSPWISVMSVFALLALAVVLFTWWNMARRQKELEARRMEEILKTPLEKFDDLEAEKLAKKYENIDPPK
jgi:flagellar basal body-associated protein FliL